MPTTRHHEPKVESPQGVVDGAPVSGPALESEIIAVAVALHRAINDLLLLAPRADAGPVALAQAVGVDKVLASRVLKAARQQDPIAALYFMPGPEPLRTLVRAAERRSPPGVTETAGAAANRAIEDFERLISVRIGDRSLLDSILSAWIPEARSEFELRRKQAAFKAISQLKGVQADAIVATCILAPPPPSADPELMDVVWLHGLTGLHRVRPGVLVKLASRRMSEEPAARRPQTLAGEPIDGESAPVISDFCSRPAPDVQIRRIGESLFYTLAGEGFGAASAVDVYFGEVNRSEIKRQPGVNPARPEWVRGWYFFAEVSVPAASLQFDLLVHDDLLEGREPMLRIHDTAFDGVADALDRRRDLDRIDMLEAITPLGRGLSGVRAARVPRYAELVQHAMSRLGYQSARFRGYRCAIEYPLYGSQVSMVFPLN